MHQFIGKWITDEEFFQLPPRNVFFRQLGAKKLSWEEHCNCHILFRKKFWLASAPTDAKIYISADDYYKLYVNGQFVGQGPAPSYTSRYLYNVLDLTNYLVPGENLIAVHTLYQGLINRVWQSGDHRHGLILDLNADGKTVIVSDESFKTGRHTAYRKIGTVGYATQFLEEYDSRAPEVGFQKPDFDDSGWANAYLHAFADHQLTQQKSKMLVFETISPKRLEQKGNQVFADFGSNYVGYLYVRVLGKEGSTVVIRCGQELDKDHNVRFKLRANCNYEETWILTDGECALEQFDYKAFRYAQLILPDGCKLEELQLQARHYPFRLQAQMNPEYREEPRLQAIWNLCVHTQKYGVQEVIQDCMEREKGFYMGDGCYTALTHMILTKDDSMVRKLIDDGFASSFITEGLVTCLDCSFMQEIAEYPMMLLFLVLWHYRLTGDKAYLSENYPRAVKVLECYRKTYEKEELLRDLDKWCVVEWPKHYQDGYDVDVREWQICHVPHVVMNAYYLEAIKTANQMAQALGLAPYRDEIPLRRNFLQSFYDPQVRRFTDSTESGHISIVGNVVPFAFGLCPDAACREEIAALIQQRGISCLSLFCTFLALMGFVKAEKQQELPALMTDEGAWLRMLREDATTTFEGWGKDTKKNASLFHMTLSYGAVFLSDTDLAALFA